MNTYEVRFTVNGKGGYSTTVQARDVMQARRIAMGEIQGQYGYLGAKICIRQVFKI